jgi:phosphotransferase system  glucose/maltose/N-acetylglucosamine-specific IIC component
MQHSFLQRVFMTIIAGAVVAFFYVFVFRTIIERSIYETSNEGYRDMFNTPKKAH